MPTSVRFIPAALIVVLCAATAHAQQTRFRQLVGHGHRTWQTVKIESSIHGEAPEGYGLRFGEDGVLAMREAGMDIDARWELSDDADELLVYGRSSGDWKNPDTLWMEIVSLTNDSLTLRYRNTFGWLRVRYAAVAEPDEGADTAGFAAFYREFKSAVAARDRKRVASMTHFPFFSYDMASFIRRPKHEPRYTRAEFIRWFDKLFDARARKLIAVSTPTPLTSDDEVYAFAVGIRSVGSSTIWVQFSRDNLGAWKLTGTDNVSW